MKTKVIIFIIAFLFAYKAEAVEVNQWYKMNFPVDAAFYTLYLNDSNDVFAGLSGKIYRSSDTGSTWKMLNTGLASPNIWSIAGRKGTNILFAGSVGLIYKSIDNGEKWTVIKNDLQDLKVSKILVNETKNIIFAVMQGSSSGGNTGIYKSMDNGNSWTATGNDVFGTNVRDIEADAVGNLYIATDKGVYKSTDDAGTWGLDCLPQYGIAKLAMNSIGDLFIATNNNGIYRKKAVTSDLTKYGSGLSFNYLTGVFVDSDDDVWAYSVDGKLAYNNHANDTWIQNISGLDNVNVSAFLEYPGKILMFATDRGIYTNKYIQHSDVIEAESNLLKIDPLPADNYINVSSDQLNLLSAQVKIYNSQGALTNAVSASKGDTQLQINTSSLANGMYILELNFNNKIYTKKLVINR